jgi:uncharacterized protein (DUF849 family)
MVPAAVGDARNCLDAEIAVVHCHVSGHCGRGALDVDAVIARADRDVPLQQRVDGRRNQVSDTVLRDDGRLKARSESVWS